jgi:predicted phage terminase large subunit-like protein
MRKDSALIGTNNSTMYARGVGGAIISKRFDIILLDDILDEENSNTPEAIAKVEQWLFQTVLPCLKPDGVVIGLGTRWAVDDVYGGLIKAVEDGGKGWRQLVIPALTSSTGDINDHESLTSYWPDYWSVERLLKRWQDLGTPMFLCAYQNDVEGLSAGDVFPTNFDYFDELPDRRLTIRMGVDLASSEKERADFTARVTTAEDDEGNFYVLSAYRDKRSSHHAEFIYDGWLAYPNMDIALVEDQQFQSTLVKQVMQDYPRIPIDGVTSDRDKTTRARAVAARYEAGKVKHRRSLKDSAFERELRSFTPKGAGHDDFVDALGFSMELGGDEFVFATVRRR